MLVAFVSVALNRGVIPETGLLNKSLKIIEIEEEEMPSALTGVVPAMVVVKLLTLPGLKSIIPSVLAIGVTMESVLTSALIEERVHVETPAASVTEHALYELLRPVSVAMKVGVSPATGLFEASFMVMVIVDVDTPSAMTGPEPVMVEFRALGPVGLKMTNPPALETGVTIDKIFVSAFNDFKLQVEVPVMSEAEQAL